jgi:hypothetical protein
MFQIHPAWFKTVSDQFAELSETVISRFDRFVNPNVAVLNANSGILLPVSIG